MKPASSSVADVTNSCGNKLAESADIEVVEAVSRSHNAVPRPPYSAMDYLLGTSSETFLVLLSKATSWCQEGSAPTELQPSRFILVKTWSLLINSCFVKSLYQMPVWGPGETVHLVKCLSCKHEDLSLIPRTGVYKVQSCNSDAQSGRDRQVLGACWLESQTT